MKSVLISIQPKWCELIASGKKTIEVRKTRPKIDEPFKVYIYQTKKPISVSFSGTGRHISEYDKTNYYNKRSGKVIGEFVCDKITMSFVGYNAEGLPSYWDILDGSCLTPNELVCYGGWKTLYGWHISDLVIYDKPKELSEFFKIGHSEYCKLEWKKRERLRTRLDEYNKRTGEKAHLNTDSDFEGCLNLLSPFKITRPPQSWCYVEGVEGK